jgi:hypothetical protein
VKIAKGVDPHSTGEGVVIPVLPGVRCCAHAFQQLVASHTLACIRGGDGISAGGGRWELAPVDGVSRRQRSSCSRNARWSRAGHSNASTDQKQSACKPEYAFFSGVIDVWREELGSADYHGFNIIIQSVKILHSYVPQNRNIGLFTNHLSFINRQELTLKFYNFVKCDVKSREETLYFIFSPSSRPGSHTKTVARVFGSVISPTSIMYPSAKAIPAKVIVTLLTVILLHPFDNVRARSVRRSYLVKEYESHLANHCGLDWHHQYATLHQDILVGRKAPKLAIALGADTGIADKLAGIFSVFYYALLSGRAFQIANLPGVVGLQEAFKPASIDWVQSDTDSAATRKMWYVTCGVRERGLTALMATLTSACRRKSRTARAFMN